MYYDPLLATVLILDLGQGPCPGVGPLDTPLYFYFFSKREKQFVSVNLNAHKQNAL